MKTFLWTAFYILVALPACLLFIWALSFAMMVFNLYSWPWPPSDAEMLAVFHERRPAFEALVAKMSEGPDSGTIALSWTDRRVKKGPWLDEVRARMRVAEVERVEFHDQGAYVDISYKAGGVFSSWYKSFDYRREPKDPPPQVIDLHGEGAVARARAALCDTDQPPELHHLCKDGIGIWANDLDVLYDNNTGIVWGANLPIDEHWSLGMIYYPKR